MTKKQSAILCTLAIVLGAISIALGVYNLKAKERYIDVLESDLGYSNEQIETLEHELAVNKEQLFWSNKELEMIYMRDEGIDYQEDE